MRGTEVRIGFVSLARHTFDTGLASEITARLRSSLIDAGLTIVGPRELVGDADQARVASEHMIDCPLDLLLVLQSTFADSSLITSIAQAVDAPLLLWAVPELRTGGRLRLNSFCGLNLAAHALKRSGHPYDYVYAEPEDTRALEQVKSLAAAGRVSRLLKQARIGRVGNPPEGLDSCQADGTALGDLLGVEVVDLDLQQLFQTVRKTDPLQVDALLEGLRVSIAGLDLLDESGVRGTLATYLALRDLGRDERLAGFAVRCWPEFFTELGCAACGAMSVLSNELVPCSCEADVNGTISQLILQWLSGEPAFGTDLVALDADKDEAVVWHCGLAPISMADPLIRVQGVDHSNRNMPLLLEFPLKPGRVTVARLSEATGSYRLIVGGGEMLRAPKSFSGTSGVLRFDRSAAEVLHTVLGEGLEHHVSLTYGDHEPALLALAKILDLPVLHI